jgi:hypothetical protein
MSSGYRMYHKSCVGEVCNYEAMKIAVKTKMGMLKIKSKIVPVLILLKHYGMKTYGGVEV